MEKRKGERTKTNDEGLFSIKDVVMRGKMLNLSREGCMISGSCIDAAAGDTVSVTLLEGVTVAGEIAWTDKEEIGVGFYRKLGEATVKYFLLGTLEHTRNDTPSDQFGRGLPPMRPDPSLAD